MFILHSSVSQLTIREVGLPGNTGRCAEALRTEPSSVPIEGLRQSFPIVPTTPLPLFFKKPLHISNPLISVRLKIYAIKID